MEHQVGTQRSHVVTEQVAKRHRSGVRNATIKLDNHSEIGIVHVVVDVPAEPSVALLTFSARQPVSTFDVMQISQLKW
jgi:hypothetical protein